MHRESFSIEIWKCNKNRNLKCKSDKEIESFLQKIFFTLFQITDKVNFASDEALNKGVHKPLKAQDNFHSQFHINLDSYLDNNNFFRINKVRDKFNRWNPFQYLEFTYIDIQSNPRWNGLQAMVDYNISRDNGKTFQLETNQILFGSYFFLSEEIIQYNRKLFNFVDLLSDIGGLLGGIMALLRLVIMYVNV